MKFEDLKEDSFVKWTSDRVFKSWDTFGKVVKLTEDNVTILTFDDFTETTISKHGDAIRDEIQLITKDEFEDAIRLSLSELLGKKTKLEIEYKRNLREIDLKIMDLNNLLK